MPDNSDELLKKARDARANAVRSRRLANQQPDDKLRLTLTGYADEMEAAAVKLEQQAFNIPPAQVKRVHQQRKQMPQEQQEQPIGDDEPS